MVALSQSKTHGPLVRFRAGITFHPQFHLLPLSS
jgi:hypothetical protein